MNPGIHRWPILLIAAPAAVSVWSGWVGLGEMAGFGIVHPLPGIWDAAKLNTAITLPVGVESYGAYALAAWLAPSTPERARRFAFRSALGSLAAGMAGQVAYHILDAAGRTRAPWWVVTIVSCLPVLVLGMGAALGHMLAERQTGSGQDTPQTSDTTETAEDGQFSPPEPIVPPTALAAAEAAHRASVAGGNPLSERKLAERFGIPRSQARRIRAEVAQEANGRHPAQPEAAPLN